MPTPEQIRFCVTQYLPLLQEGDRAVELTALFADDATIEDPFGANKKAGQDVIAAHFTGAAALDLTTELLALRIAGDTGIVLFKVSSVEPGKEWTNMPIDAFTLNDDGLITSMRAYYGPSDYTTAALG